MTRLRFAFDRSNRSRDSDGRLHVRDSVITAAVVSPYRGDEIPDYTRLGLDPSKTYRLLRHPDELRKAVASFDGVPLLDRHRPAHAEDHPQELTVGAVWNPRFDGNRLIADLVIWPEYASRAVEDGTTPGLSAGYAFVADMTPTVWHGERADGVMRDITANHVAIVSEPRVPDALVADSAFNRGSNHQMRHHNTFRGIYLAADAAIRRRRARDAEPTEGELDNEDATPEDLLAIVEDWLVDMDPQDAEKLLDGLLELKANHENEQAVDRAHTASRAHTATRAHRAGDRHRLAGDALPGIRPAHERFKNLGRITVMG